MISSFYKLLFPPCLSSNKTESKSRLLLLLPLCHFLLSHFPHMFREKVYRKSLTTVKRKKEKEGKRMPHHKFPGEEGKHFFFLRRAILPFSHKSFKKTLHQIETHLKKDKFMSINRGNCVRGRFSSFSNTVYVPRTYNLLS